MKKKAVEIKLNIGCGGRPLPGYINIDADDLETLKRRYPQQQFSNDIKIYPFDIFNLPFADETIAEIKADSLIEHLAFIEEPLFFYEVKRVLRGGGIFHFSTTDFEKIVKMWLSAEDDWQDFFRDDDEAIAQNHWFGQYSYAAKNRWGYLCAMLFGSQKGEKQFHKNCYTVPKIKAILKHLKFQEIEISNYKWQGNRDPMIQVRAMKSPA